MNPERPPSGSGAPKAVQHDPDFPDQSTGHALPKPRLGLGLGLGSHSQSASPHGLHQSNPKSGRTNVLLVEDVRVSQKVAQVALQKHRYKVDVANDGQDAVDRYQGGEYHIILMDINLPKMNGVDATIKIRDIEQKENRPKALIFGLTGSLSQEDLGKYKQVGMNGCIAKGNVLADALKEALDEHEKHPDQFVVSRVNEHASTM